MTAGWEAYVSCCNDTLSGYRRKYIATHGQLCWCVLMQLNKCIFFFSHFEVHMYTNSLKQEHYALQNIISLYGLCFWCFEAKLSWSMHFFMSWGVATHHFLHFDTLYYADIVREATADFRFWCVVSCSIILLEKKKFYKWAQFTAGETDFEMNLQSLRVNGLELMKAHCNRSWLVW